ncbi:hypothetical protein Ahy_A10g050328 [Arachis hypogaea]|uniref:Uncharacterized protein n=1 Tax=Arachis hypogaea TaxID=3818 RepID=A0A445B967_ARAHY|nr:hypothetical protein Ahy_A10g050328 [Arachis hypogaea]
MSHFKSTEGKRYLISVAYSPRKIGYEWYMDALTLLSQEMANWASRFNKEIWLQHCDGDRRFGHMITNLSECMNPVLKVTRYLPISAIMRCTYERKGILTMRFAHYNRRTSVFVVDELEPFKGWSQELFRVCLAAGMCDCGLF